MAESADLLTLKSTLGGYVRRGNHEAAEQARRALALAKTEATIAKAIATAPELTADEIRKLRDLIPPLRPVDGPGA